MSFLLKDPNFTTKVTKIEPRIDTNKHELLEIGVHSWFHEHDIAKITGAVGVGAGNNLISKTTSQKSGLLSCKHITLNLAAKMSANMLY